MLGMTISKMMMRSPRPDPSARGIPSPPTIFCELASTHSTTGIASVLLSSVWILSVVPHSASTTPSLATYTRSSPERAKTSCRTVSTTNTTAPGSTPGLELPSLSNTNRRPFLHPGGTATVRERSSLSMAPPASL